MVGTARRARLCPPYDSWPRRRAVEKVGWAKRPDANASGGVPTIRLMRRGRNGGHVIARASARPMPLPTLRLLPPARSQPLAQMRRRRCHHAHRVLVLRNRNPDLARMQMQPRLAESRSVAVNII